MIEDLLAEALDEKEDPKHIHQYVLWLKHNYITEQRIEKNYKEMISLLEETRTTMQAGFRMMDEHFDKIQKSLEEGIAYSQKQIDTYSSTRNNSISSNAHQENTETRASALQDPYPRNDKS